MCFVLCTRRLHSKIYKWELNVKKSIFMHNSGIECSQDIFQCFVESAKCYA